MKAYGYLRASTDKQTMSPEVQREKILAYFEYRLKPKGYEWGGFYEDPDTSSLTPLRSRPAGSRLFLDLDFEDAIVFATLDRPFRNTAEALEVTAHWETQGVSVHFLDLDVDTSSPVGRLFFTISAGVAEMERKQVSIRTKDAFAFRRRKNQPTGRPRYGWRLVGRRGYNQRLVPDVETRAMTSKWIELYEAGYTLHQIVQWCEQEGITYETGTKNNPRQENPGIFKIRSNMIKEVHLRASEKLAAAEGRTIGPYDMPSGTPTHGLK